MLKVAGLNAWYGESHILHGVDFEVAEGEVVTLLGRNGAGKTTTMKSIMGLVGRRAGSIRYRGDEIAQLRPDLIARRGIALCPEERGIFASLDVTENLMLPPRIAEGGLDLERIYALFPNLKERAHSQGTKLSGGEQQMLAIARILRTGATPAAARRTHRGPGPGDCAANRPHHPRDQERWASPCCWWNRTSASPPPSPTAIM
jgi:branched-chain amino acid transport system ATP-binding protein